MKDRIKTIRRRLEDRGHTMDSVGMLLDVSRQSVSAYIHRRRSNPEIERQIAELIGIPVEKAFPRKP